MATSKLPQPGDSVPGGYVYTLQLDVTVVGIGVLDEVNPVASNRQAIFGTDANGNETISYLANNGTTVSQAIANVGAYQDSSAFSYVSGGTLYLFSNTALTGLATVTVNGTQVSVLPATALSTTQGQYIYPAGGTVVAPAGLTLAPASDTGVRGDDTTSVTTPVITGTGEAGSTVTLQDGSTTIGTAMVASNGTWSITTTTLGAGQHTITAYDTDGSGNVSARSAALTLNIDTATPATPTLLLASASDSGVKGDGITNVSNPIVTGTGTAGDTVTLYATSGSGGSTAIGTATVGSGGTWSITSPTLAAGAHSLTAIQSDVAGNVSATSTPLNLTIDTATPATPTTLALAIASDSGVPGDGITNVTTPTITGTGTAGDTVTLYDGTTIVGTGTVAAGGTWSVVSSALAAGSHSLTATQADVAGNVSAPSATVGLTIDTAKPATPGTPALAASSDTGVQGDDITSVTTPTITGTGTAGDTVTLRDGGTVVGSGTVASNGSWSIVTTTLASGSHTLAATQTDVAGNVSTASAALRLTIDTATPSTPASLMLATASDSGAIGDDTTNVATPTITGTGTAGDTVRLYDGATLIGSATVGSNGGWSVATTTLAAGLHSLTATQTDVAGNVSAASTALGLTIDTAAPSAPIALALAGGSDSGVQGDGITNVVTPTITGTGAAGDTVTLLDGSTAIGTATVTGGGTWSITTGTLAAGPHSLTATQTDIAGNVSAASATLGLTIDTTTPSAPSAPMLAVSSDSGIQGDGITNVATPVVTGTGTAGDTVTLLDGSTVIGSATVATDDTWSITSSTLAPGAHSLTAMQTDVAGNASGASAALGLNIDTATPSTQSAPVLAAVSDSGVQGDGVTNVTTPLITGTGTPGDTVTLLDSTAGGGTTIVGTATVAANGIWSITSSTLAAGTHSLTTTQADVAGNVSGASAPLNLTIDIATPATPTTLALGAASDSGVMGDGITNVTTPTITGTGTAGDTVTLYDGNAVVGTETVAGNGTWAITSSTLPAGTDSLTATQTDIAGNLSAVSTALTLQIDTVTPSAPSNLALASTSDSGVAGDDITNVTSPTLTGIGVAGDTVTVIDGGTAVGNATVASNGTWQVTTSALADGSHSLVAMQTDVAGNVSANSAALALDIDSTPAAAPSAPVLAAGSDSGTQGDDITNITTPTLTGTGTAGDTVTLYDTAPGGGSVSVGSASVAANGSWSIATGTLVGGSNSLTAVQTDTAGNRSAASAPVTLTIDTAAPTAPLNLTLAPASDTGVPGDDITSATTPTITGTGTAGDTVTLYDANPGGSGTAIGTGAVGIDGRWSIVTAPLAGVVHSLIATQADVAGNVSAASNALGLTIDTATPAAPGTPVLADASDSGVKGDGITGVTTPTITGSGVAGDTITLLDTSESGTTTAVGTATVAADNTWSVVSSALAAGTNSLTAVQTDVAGNSSTASPALVLAIDTAAPGAPGAPVLSAASDSGVKGDNVTNVINPVLTGTGVAGDTVTLLDGSTVAGTATVAGNGTWSITSTTLAAGPHSLTATQTDAAGNVSAASTPLTLSIDTGNPATPSAPVLSSASDSGTQGDDITNVTTPVLNGSGPVGDTVTLYDVDPNGTSTILGTALVGSNNVWSITSPALTPGLHRLTATYTDANGNISAPSAALGLTVDNATPAPPSAPALAAGSDSGTQGDGITNVTTPTLTGNGIAGDTVTLSDTNAAGVSTIIGTATVASSGTWSVASNTLAAGAHSLTATQTDSAGNVSASSAALAIDIDTTPPAAPSAPLLDTGSDSGAQGDHITNVTTPTLTGNGIAGDAVTLFDGSTAIGSGIVGSGGTWSIATTTLANGAHGITAVQTDAAGNASLPSAALGLTIDTAAPHAPSTPVLAAASDSGVQGDDTTNVTTPSLTGTGAAGDTMTLYATTASGGTTVVGTATVAGDGTWLITSSALGAGSHSFTVAETDSAGNISAASQPLVLDIDTAAPSAPSTPMLNPSSDSGLLGDDITNVAAPTVTGTGTAGDTVTLYDTNASGVSTVVGSATVAGGGTWSITTSTLAAGSHNLSATQTDFAGNVSTPSTALGLTIDIATPGAPGTPMLATTSDSGVQGDDITNVSAPTITGTGAVGDTVTLSAVASGGGSTIVGTATVGADGNWSIATGPLAAGMHDLTATQTDVAGNISAASLPLGLDIDTATPATPGSLALAAASDSGNKGDAVTNVTTPTITGTGTGGDTVTLYDGTTVLGTATVASDGTWSVNSSTLAAGAHSLTATEKDVAGNVSGVSNPLTVTIATTAPMPPASLALATGSDSGVQGDDITNITNPVITGTGAVGDTVTLLDGSTVVGSGVVGAAGTWSITSSTLADGVHSLGAVQTDYAGNQSVPSAALRLDIDTMAPAAPTAPVLAAASDSGTPGDDITNVATPVLTGTGTAGNIVTLLDSAPSGGATIIGTGTVSGNGTWAITSNLLGDGTHVLTATQTDAAGNLSGASAALALVIDTNPPAAPSAPALAAASDGGVVGDNITNVTTPTLTGTGTAGDTIDLLEANAGGGTTIVGITTVAADGTWSVSSSTLAAGTHSLIATDTDEAGNVSAASPALDLVIDTAAPAATYDPGARRCQRQRRDGRRHHQRDHAHHHRHRHRGRYRHAV